MKSHRTALQKESNGSDNRSEALLSLQETEAKGMSLAFISLVGALTHRPSKLGRCSDRRK